MSADLTREQAREQVARAIHAEACCPDWPSPYCDGPTNYSDIDAALTVLWPVVESLRADVDAYRAATVELLAAIASLKAELAHAHTVIARHVEPRRGAGFDRSCCAKCEGKYLDAEAERQGLPSVRFMRFMVVCPACGSKRCPRAADHDLACEADPRGEGHK